MKHGLRNIATQLALAAMVAALTAGRAAGADALDPNAELSDARLNKSVAQALADGVTLYNSGKYREAYAKIDEARAVPGTTPYDMFRIDALTAAVALPDKDFERGLAASENMAASPALPGNEKAAVYHNALLFNLQRRNYWRAIQYGEMTNRIGALGPEYAYLLADAYFMDGAYADAENTAQTALNAGVTGDMQEKLSDLVQQSQRKTGEKPPSAGETLLGAILGGAIQGVADGMSGQQSEAPDFSAQGIMARQQQKAGQEMAAAQQHAASEILAAPVTYERAVYTDLSIRSQQMNKRTAARANQYFVSAEALWEKEDYSGAMDGFKNGLDIDPANGLANYYYADCLARADGDGIKIVDYLARATAFENGTSDANQAREALQGLASPQQN